MGIEQDAQNNAMQKKGMNIDPNWSDAEKEKYMSSYVATQKKEETKDRIEEERIEKENQKG
ncbi:MAG: hypothetical protein KKA05_00860 [Alphaproteobacteria bacterium]|nr:hypothetical protein [Alphaproteobacteria bacterium]MBU0859840.1 hypothetical protein [Alphaproteobacteria bacterium]